MSEIISRPFDEAVAAGQIHQWSEVEGSEERADPARFNQNERYLADTLHQVEEAHDLRLDAAARAIGQLSQSKADAELTAEAINNQVREIQALRRSLEDAVNGLKGGVTADGDTLAKLRRLILGLQTLVGSDDVSLDSLQEIVGFIKSNASVLESVTTDKANTADVISVFQSLTDAFNACAQRINNA